MGYIDKTGNRNRHIRLMELGSFEFRKRLPKASGLSGEFKRRFRARCAVTMAQAYARVLAEYDARANGRTVDVAAPTLGPGPLPRSSRLHLWSMSNQLARSVRRPWRMLLTCIFGTNCGWVGTFRERIP